MAQYGSANADQEFYDSPEVIEQKVDKLVELIKKSGHFIVFTGAGISTSAGSCGVTITTGSPISRLTP